MTPTLRNKWLSQHSIVCDMQVVKKNYVFIEMIAAK